jgi:hypothetical protein
MDKDPNKAPHDAGPPDGPASKDNVVDFSPSVPSSGETPDSGSIPATPEVLTPASHPEAESFRLRRRRLRNRSNASRAATQPQPTVRDEDCRGFIPRCSESLLVLGLLSIAAWGCWLLYGPFIQFILKQFLPIS